MVFSVEQDIDKARAHYAAFKARLPALGRTPDAVEIMPVVGRTDREAFDTLGEWFGAGAADGFNIMPPYLPVALMLPWTRWSLSCRKVAGFAEATLAPPCATRLG